MQIIEDFWPRVLGTCMWALFTLAGFLLTLMQIAIVGLAGWGIYALIF